MNLTQTSPWTCSACNSRFDCEAQTPTSRFLSKEYPRVCLTCWDLWHILKQVEEKNKNVYWSSLQWAYEAEKRAREDDERRKREGN